MITNFEEITKPLTSLELIAKDQICLFQSVWTKDNPKKAPFICGLVSDFLDKKFTQNRLRKVVNYIRGVEGLPLIATSRGYYFTTDKKEIEREIKSLEERADAILFAASGLKKSLEYQQRLF